MAEKPGEKYQSKVKPVCKYGIECYQKNPEHLQKYSHPSPNSRNVNRTLKLPEKDNPLSKKSRKRSHRKRTEGTSSDCGNLKDVASSDTTESSSKRKNEKKESPLPLSVSLQADLQEKLLLKMPPDFFDLWEFCIESYWFPIRDPSEVFAGLGLRLVGPYDVLASKVSKIRCQGDKFHCHYRFYYDPPEFQTVIVKDGDDWYHIGYFRDDPSELPFGLASNSAAVGPEMKLLGDNIFAALNFELNAGLKTAKKSVKDKFTKLQENLKKFAEMRNYSLDTKTPKTEARNKKVNAKTFHNLGIVVPYNEARRVGYRSLGVTNAKLKSILKKISDCKTEDEKLSARSELDEILVCLQFANDECDYGMGLELGIDLFCFGDPYLHKDILMVLKLAYNLLDRPLFSRIIEAHLTKRIKNNKVSCELDDYYLRH